ncbi:MAG TPA: cupredoxin domain-containing protein [Acidimicrobiia bacterium]|nr:cupredoxin domain-containing protein [Acidimicrobiia bacterium]
MSRIRSVTAVVTVALALGLALVAGAGPAEAAKAKAGTVTIKNFKFSPSPLKVKAGTKVTVKNADSTTHTFTANKGAFDTGDIDSGSSATVTIKKPGTYAYHCEIHNFMKGTIKAS